MSLWVCANEMHECVNHKVKLTVLVVVFSSQYEKCNINSANMGTLLTN